MPQKKQIKLHGGQTGAAIVVRVVPGASRNEISEISDDGTIMVRLMVAGVENNANQALIQFFADVLEVPAAAVEIVAGQSGKDKLVTILNLDSNTVHNRIIKQVK